VKFAEYSRGKTDCRIYQVGIYLQDHDQNRQGLWAIPKSHLQDGLSSDSAVYFDTRMGDLAMWDVRTSHSGQETDFFEHRIGRLANRIFKKPTYYGTRAKDVYWRLTGKKDRLLLIFAIGVPNEYTRTYSDLMLIKGLQRRGLKVLRPPAKFLEECARHGISTPLSASEGEYRVEGNRIETASGKRIEAML
jgi:hypothetical protein